MGMRIFTFAIFPTIYFLYFHQFHPKTSRNSLTPVLLSGRKVKATPAASNASLGPPFLFMATPAQIAANRLNAQKSTGPRSDEGKAVSRFNALKHAATARSLIIPGEEEAALDELSAAYREQFQPVGPEETLLVEKIIA